MALNTLLISVMVIVIADMAFVSLYGVQILVCNDNIVCLPHGLPLKPRFRIRYVSLIVVTPLHWMPIL